MIAEAHEPSTSESQNAIGLASEWEGDCDRDLRTQLPKTQLKMDGGHENAPRGWQADMGRDRALANAAGEKRIARMGEPERGSP